MSFAYEERVDEAVWSQVCFADETANRLGAPKSPRPSCKREPGGGFYSHIRHLAILKIVATNSSLCVISHDGINERGNGKRLRLNRDRDAKLACCVGRRRPDDGNHCVLEQIRGLIGPANACEAPDS